jgi:hypothetical protein
MQIEELFAAVFCLVVLSGVFIVYMGLRQRSQQLEMRHKERMAMIERGISPASESSRVAAVIAARSMPSSRSLTLGIVIVAFGLALATVISLAGESPGIGLGIGGGIAIIGAGFIVNSMVARGSAPAQLPPTDDQV